MTLQEMSEKLIVAFSKYPKEERQKFSEDKGKVLEILTERFGEGTCKRMIEQPNEIWTKALANFRNYIKEGLEPSWFEWFLEEKPIDEIELFLTRSGVDIQDERRRTAFIISVQQHLSRLFPLLKKLGADPNSKDQAGWTALMYPCVFSNQKTLENVLSFSPDLNATDSIGNTALMMSCESGSYVGEQIIKRLLDEGADCSIINRSGETAYSLACQRADSSILALFPKEKRFSKVSVETLKEAKSEIISFLEENKEEGLLIEEIAEALYLEERIVASVLKTNSEFFYDNISIYTGWKLSKYRS